MARAQLLRQLNVQLSVIGNHDLDFGLATFAALAANTGVWVIANIQPQLGGTKPYHIMEVGGVRVAFVGLAGTDFIGTLNFDASAMV
jgi:2',3'-cyclic-nucleotide 2'-phosphodiesterase (5'-nucleotidase family)